MADEFDLIEARISVKINDGDLDGVKEQIDALTKKLNKLKVGVGMRLIGRKEFRDELRRYLAGIKTGNKALISPVLANKSQLTKQIKEATAEAVGKGVSIKVSADAKEAEAALDRVIGKSRTVSSAGKRAAGSVDYLELQVKRWGRLNGRLAESRRLLDQISQPGFGSADDMEKIRSQMAYYDRLQSQAARIADLSGKLKEWGELPGRMAKSQQLLAEVSKAGFGSQADFRRVDREMLRLDRTINNTARKNEAKAYINEWGKASGKIQEAADLLKFVDQNDIFKSSDFKAIRQLTSDIDKAAAAAARAQKETAKLLATANKQINIVEKPTPGNKAQFKNPFIPIEKFQSDAIDVGQKARADEQKKAIDRAKEELNVRKKLSTQSILDAAQKKAAYEFTRGRRDDAKVTTEDISWAAPLVRRREEAARAAKEEADRQAKIREDAEERVRSELKLERLRTKAFASLTGKAVEEDAKNTARQEFIAGKRKSDEITRKDLENSSKKLRVLQQMRSLEESQNARAKQLLELTKATANAEVRRLAQKKADFDLRLGKRTNRDLTEQDLRLASAIYEKKKKITDAERRQEQAAAKIRVSQRETAARVARRDQALRSVLFEAGFVAGPVTAVLGNLVGVSNQTKAFINNSTAAAKVAGRLGVSVATLGNISSVAASGLTVLAGAVVKLLSISFGIVNQFAQQAIGGLVEGFKAVIGPALALFQAIRGIASYLPLVAAGIAGFVGETLTKATVEFDKIQSLFKFTFADQAASQLNLVRQVSDSFGLSLDALAVGYGKLAAAAKNSGVTQEEIRQLFIGTSSAAAVFKLNQGDLDGVFRAYQQIISKSVVSSEELRQQLSERLPAAFSLAASALGKSQQDLNEALANGSVTAEEFIPAFGRALRQAYDQNASGIVDTLPAKLNRLENSLLDLQRSAEGTKFLESFVDLKQGLIDPFIKDGAIKDALKNVFVEAGKAFRFFTAQIPLAIDLLKNVWEAVRPLVEAFATLQLVFSALAIAAAKELVQVDRITEVTFGRSVRTIRDFSQRVTQALNLDLSDFRSIMAFVDAIIRRSDLALAAFTAALEATIKAILVFATTLYAALIPVMLNLGVQLGKSIAEGIWKGLAGTSERGEIEREIARIDESLKNPNRIGAGFGTVTIPPDNGATIRRREELVAKIANLDKESTPEGMAKGVLISLDNALKNAANQFKSPELVERLEELGASVRESFKNLLPVTEQEKPDMPFLGFPLTELRKSLGAGAATTSDFESQFFGFEEFQRFLQSGTNEQVRVAENTQRIYEVGQQQLDALNKLNISQQATNNLLIGEGAYMRAPSTLRWEN